MTAKSRLKPETKKRIQNQLSQDFGPKSRSIRKSNHSSQNNLLQRYVKHLPLLFLSMPLYFLVRYIFYNIYPNSIAHFPIYNSYLGIMAPFLLANFFLLSYLFLNLKRGFSYSLLLSIIFYLRLQQFVFEYWWFLPLVICFVIVDQFIRIKSRNEKQSEKTFKSSRAKN